MHAGVHTQRKQTKTRERGIYSMILYMLTWGSRKKTNDRQTHMETTEPNMKERQAATYTLETNTHTSGGSKINARKHTVHNARRWRCTFGLARHRIKSKSRRLSLL